MDLNKLMQQAQQMQSGLQKTQEELAQKEVEGTSASGKVKATVTCAGDVTKLELDPTIVDPEDTTFLQDLILEAIKNAQAEGKKINQEEMGKLTGGLGGGGGIPGLF